MMKTALLHHPVCIKHEARPGHPERPERLIVLEQQLHASPVMDWIIEIEAPMASLQQIGRVHTQAYISMVESTAPAPGEPLVQLDPDTAMNEYSLEATKRGAGAACEAARMVHNGEARHAFCAVRPCGHHATRERLLRGRRRPLGWSGREWRSTPANGWAGPVCTARGWRS